MIRVRVSRGFRFGTLLSLVTPRTCINPLLPLCVSARSSIGMASKIRYGTPWRVSPSLAWLARVVKAQQIVQVTVA